MSDRRGATRRPAAPMYARGPVFENLRWASLKPLGIAAAVALLLVGAWSLRLRPHTYSVGDEALLEIYTLHAANGTLRVGPYSRFTWNHPGPTYFYLLAPTYALSGYREDGLYLGVLAINVTLLAVLITFAFRGGGHRWPTR